jgi:hypothetical protein
MIETLEVFLLFVLRLGIPLLITFLFSRYLKHLDEKWRQEGLEITEKNKLSQPALPAVRCWEVRGCSPETRSGCPAYLQSTPCWEFFRVNGQMNKKCSGCSVGKQALMPMGI